MASFTCICLLSLLSLVRGSAQLELLVSGYNRNLTRTSVSLDSGSVAGVHTAAWRVDLNMSWLQLQETVCTFCYQIYAVHEARLLHTMCFSLVLSPSQVFKC